MQSIKQLPPSQWERVQVAPAWQTMEQPPPGQPSMTHWPPKHSSEQAPWGQLRIVQVEPESHSRWQPAPQSLMHWEDCEHRMSHPPPVHRVVHVELAHTWLHPPEQSMSQVDPST